MDWRHLTSVIGVGALFLVFAGGARATASAWIGLEPRQCTENFCELPATTLVVTGGPENNTMSIRVDAGGATISDSTGVSAGSGCTAVGLTSARCAFMASELHLRLRGAAGSDSISAVADRAVEALLEGGDGDDTLSGTESGDVLRGGAGSDKLFGRGSARHADSLDGGPGSDLLDGGAGEDELLYAGATAPVDVDLQRGTGNGQPGENDTTAAIEEIRGVPRGSTLAGDAGPNNLELPSATGTLAGRGGADTLTRGSSASGGTGNDTFYDVSGSIACDSGRDVVNGIARRVSLGCEEVYDPAFEMIGLRELGRIGGTFASTELSCDPLSLVVRPRGRTCPGALAASSAGRRIAGGAVKLPLGRSRKLVARLDKAGQRLLKRRGTLEVKVSYSFKTPGTKTQRGSFRTTLRRP